MDPEDDMQSEKLTELATWLVTDMDAELDLEVSTPASGFIQRHCWWLTYLLQYLALTVVLGTGEVCLQIFMLCLRVLWPVIAVWVCVHMIYTYISIRAAIPPSAYAELRWAIKTRQVPGKQIEQHVQGATFCMLGLAIAWEVLSFVVSRKSHLNADSRKGKF